MKKIIYSLVIMIAAGSLFTSCIEQVEPLGIQDMRFAKAEYIRALKDLRAADAELVRAQAAHEQARARYVDAMTANLNADTEYQKLLNEYQQLLNEARQDTNDFISQQTANKIDSIKKRMELRELEHAKDMADAKKALAEAEELLRVALRNIELSAQDLTKNEKDAVIAAVKAYKYAFEQTANQRITVLKKQRELDSLKLYSQIGDTVYDKGSKAYIGQVEKYKKDIERNEIKQIALAALLLAVPDSLDYEDVNAWQEQLEQLSADSAAVAYEQYQDKIEMANYYTTYIHDGVDYFNTVASEWAKNNPRPTWTTTDSTNYAKGEPKRSDYPDQAKPEDSIKTFKKFLFDSDKISQETYNKFAYLLNSYRKGNPLSAATPKNPIIKIVYNGTDPTNADSIYFASPISQKTGRDMKTFILGAAGNGEKSQKFKDTVANYGLWGAYDILERELVTAPGEDPAKDSAQLHKNMDKMDSIWTAHRQILINGVAAYVPFNEAKSALASEEEENGKGAAKMVQAIKDINTAFAAVAGQTAPSSFDGFDSTEFFKAIIDFAKAREEYLSEGYTAPTAEFNKGDRTTWNKNYFYYSEGSAGTEKPIIASKKFSELTFPELKNGTYNKVIWADDGLTEKGYDKLHGFYNIIDQLFGDNDTTNPFITVIHPATVDTKMATLSVDDANAKKALYGVYGVSTSWADPKNITKDGTPFVPAELAKAKDTVTLRINEYVAAYNSFWNVTVATTTSVEAKATVKGTEYTKTQTVDQFIKDYTDAMDAGVADNIAVAEALLTAAVEKLCDKSTLDPECYTLATFKPYGNKKPIVYYTDGKIDKTDAMKAILTSVDPAATSTTDHTQWDAATFEARSAIFKGGLTDFAQFMKAAYDYYKSKNTEAIKDLETVKAWIDDVEKQFTEDAKVKSREQEYKTAKDDYDTAVARKPRIEDWRKKLQEFAGEDAYELKDTVMLSKPTMTANDFTKIEEVLIGNAVEGLTPFGYYPGEWNKKLGGEQLELAKTLFPDYPEKIAEWYADMKIAADELVHYQTLIKAAKDAYIAAATVAEENVGGATTWDQLIANYTAANKAYRKRLADEIEALQTEIDTWTQSLAQFEAGKPAREIAIAEKAKELAVETAKLQNYEEALAYAKANLDRILEYVKSLDSNFVIPSSPDMYPNNYSIW